MASLLYGSGLRLMECVRLRVIDLIFHADQIHIQNSKGQNARITVLPVALKQPLERRLSKVKALHEEDLADGFGGVYLPYALEEKYPLAAKMWAWQYVFPASSRSGGSPFRESSPSSPLRNTSPTSREDRKHGSRGSLCLRRFIWQFCFFCLSGDFDQIFHRTQDHR